MQEEATTVAIKTGATILTTGFAAFGLTGWAVAAAISGAAAALHFQKEATPDTIWKIAGTITAQGFLAAMLASLVTYVPFCAWTESVPVAVRAGVLGVLASPLYMLTTFLIDKLRGFFSKKLGE